MIKKEYSMYAYFDGDSIGNHIELLLINGHIEEAGSLSRNLNIALEVLKDELVHNLKATIILYGGDDILIEFKEKENDIETIQQARKKYLKNCGHSISCGCGETIRETVEYLRMAKLMGKNNFIYNNKII